MSDRDPFDQLTLRQIIGATLRGIAYGLLAAAAIGALMYWAAN